MQLQKRQLSARYNQTTMIEREPGQQKQPQNILNGYPALITVREHSNCVRETQAGVVIDHSCYMPQIISLAVHGLGRRFCPALLSHSAIWTLMLEQYWYLIRAKPQDKGGPISYLNRLSRTVYIYRRKLRNRAVTLTSWIYYIRACNGYCTKWMKQ